jgi:protein SCO1/2
MLVLVKNALVALWFAIVACGGDVTRSWDVDGVVLDVNVEYQQVLIDHQEIEGFMPAMTMNFDVTDAALLDGIEKGQAVSFRLHYDGKRYSVTRIRVLSVGEAAASGLSLGGVPLGTAPEFTLTDQDGASVSLAELRGKAVVLDFIYTHCPGPCPIMTGILRDAQQLLPEELRERTQFVSVTVDPARDTPDVLRAYAGHRGLDTGNWSLLTGSPEQVSDVLRRYGVATEPGENGEISHVVVTLLIDPQGNIDKRWLGTRHTHEQVVEAVGRVLAGTTIGTTRGSRESSRGVVPRASPSTWTGTGSAPSDTIVAWRTRR